MLTLFIDTTKNTEATVGLFIDDQKFFLKKVMLHRSSQVVLPLIEEILQKYKKNIRDLTNIEVALGPGSFTGVRVGVSIANALAFALDIPINGEKKSVEPVYE